MEHHIEEVAQVYLRLNAAGDAWEIDSPTLDGSPLYGYDEGAIDDECQCGWQDDDKAREEHDQILERVHRSVDLPTAEELYHLLGRALGKEE